MQDKKHLAELHSDHLNWISHLNLIQDEIGSLENRLGEIVAKNTDTSILKDSEQYQNKLRTHQDQIARLLHDIREHEQFLAQHAEANPIASDHRLYADSASIRERFDTEVKIFSDLKADVFSFVGKYL